MKWMGQLVSDDTLLETTAESKRTGYNWVYNHVVKDKTMSSQIPKKFIHFAIPAAFAI